MSALDVKVFSWMLTKPNQYSNARLGYFVSLDGLYGMSVPYFVDDLME